MKDLRDKNRLRCNVEKSSGIFFSLVDYRNTLFTSNNPEGIIKFYDGFHNRDDLIEWMKERPKGASYIHEVEGDNDIIVVIPTADFEGKFAKTCRENIFKGLHMIFIESGGRGDFYFNISHNINVGIKRAIKYNPKWIVITGDDLIKIDGVNILVDRLQKIDPQSVDAIFIKPSKYHSVKGFVGTPNYLNRIVTQIFLSKIKRKKYELVKKFCGLNQFWPLAGNSISRKIVNRLLYNRELNVIWSIDFIILSINYVKKQGGICFDETYVATEDDADLSLRIAVSGKYTFIDYKIDEYIAGTRGNGIEWQLRPAAGLIYFSYKLEKGIIKIPTIKLNKNY